MPFEAYLARPYEHSHETQAFATLVQNLKTRFGSEPGLHLLVGNLMFSNNEADAILFKENAITIVEMKSHGGRVLFNENTPWLVGGQQVRGGTRENPFLQLRAYRIALRQYLKHREPDFLRPIRDIDWRQISAVVLFANPIQFEECLPIDLRAWFHVTDMARVADKLANVRTGVKLTGDEIKRFLAKVGITALQRYEGQIGSPTTAANTDLKGFEFRLVIIVGCDAGALPYTGIPRDEIWREALRLYVAMTRGRDQIFLLYQGDQSEFLQIMGDSIVHREEPVLKPYIRHTAPEQPQTTPPTALQPANATVAAGAVRRAVPIIDCAVGSNSSHGTFTANYKWSTDRS